MKKVYLFLLAVSGVMLINFLACDSATDSVATNVTAPSPVTPADNATGVSRTPTFTWTGEADKLEVATNNNFNPVVHPATVSGTQYVFNGQPLDANTTFFWRVGKTSGGTVYWSTNNFRFTTGN